jgi:hypothetical protein
VRRAHVGKTKINTKFLSGILKERGRLRDLSVDGTVNCEVAPVSDITSYGEWRFV